MNAPSQTDIKRWLRETRGSLTQDDLARDISAETGWRITRDRYSRYEGGSLAVGPKVLKHFVDYWAARGVEGPTAETKVEPEPTLAAAITALVAELQASRLERKTTEARLRAVEAELESLRGPRAGAGSVEQPALLG